MANPQVEMPTDLLAGLLMEHASAQVPAPRKAVSQRAKVHAVMAVTSLLTFGTLVTGHQLLFSHQLFA